MLTVIPEQIIAGHGLKVSQPADRGMPVRMRVERRSRQFLIEQLLGIVFSALQLRNDHGPLGLDVCRVVQAIRHALGFDEQHVIERVPCRRLGVRRLIDPGVAVPVTAVLLDDAFDLLTRNIGRPLEVHVLDPVRNTGHAGRFVFRSDAVPAPDGGEGRRVHLLDQHPQPVLQHLLVHGHPEIIGAARLVRGPSR